MDLLFTAFVAVQFRYLFGGADLVGVTPGLTYAEYAREGFGQLALASALVLPSLLLTDWLLNRESRRDEWVFRCLGGLQLLLLVLVLVVASATQRVRAYEAAYGLTESRFYGTMLLGWLVLLGAWFAATILRGRRHRFAFPTLASGFALVAALFVVNPDVRIARTNLARAGFLVSSEPGAPRLGTPTDPSGPPDLDVEYLVSLGADAVPTLLDVVPNLPPGPQCTLARGLLERWESREGLDWRSWNRAIVQARRAIRGDAAALRCMAGRDGPCPPG